MAKYGLYIGIDEYAEQDHIQRLRYAALDANQVQLFFYSCGFRPHLLVNSQASFSGITAKLEEVSEKLKPGDVFLFYFSGHGVQAGQPGEERQLLLPQDVRLKTLKCSEAGAIPLRLVQTITRVEGVSRAIVLDACRWPLSPNKGAATEGQGTWCAGKDIAAVAREAPRESPLVIVCSCRPEHHSYEHSGVQGSLFTKAMLAVFEGQRRQGAPLCFSGATCDAIAAKVRELGTEAQMPEEFVQPPWVQNPHEGVVLVPGVPAPPPPAPRPTSPSPPTPPPGKELIVDAAGRGTHRSIRDAVAGASPGARIRVRPGTYRESLVIEKHVEIVGDGPAGDIILESPIATCLRLRTDRGLVRGLTIRCRAGGKNLRSHAVDISKGQPVIEQCDITSDSSACVRVAGADAAPVLRDCALHDGQQAGLCIEGGAKPVVEHCDIFANAHVGVEIRDGADPTLRKCTLRDGRSVGLFVHHAAKGTMLDCDIAANALPGVIICDAADPVLRRCQIRDGKEGGVLVHARGKGALKDCDIRGNARAGVEIRDGADPLLRRCQIRDSQQSGLLAHASSKGTIEHCDITGNALAGVEIREEAAPTLTRCRIRKNAGPGIWAYRRGAGLIARCDLADNAGGAWVVDATCTLRREP